jgi:hypothetical protein
MAWETSSLMAFWTEPSSSRVARRAAVGVVDIERDLHMDKASFCVWMENILFHRLNALQRVHARKKLDNQSDYEHGLKTTNRELEKCSDPSSGSRIDLIREQVRQPHFVRSCLSFALNRGSMLFFRSSLYF